jgi:hypothetical protein
MSLILPPWYFANEVDNNTGTPNASSPGTSVTPGTSNADGTAVSVLSGLSFDAHYLVVGLSGFLVSTAAFYCLLDVLADPAGGTSWGSFIDDLVCGMTVAQAATVGTELWYYFPVFIKSGTSLGVQARTSHSAAGAGKVIMYAYGNPSRPEMWWCGQKVETLGVTAASSVGTNVTPGNSGAFGSWTTIGTSTQRYGAIQHAHNGTDSSSAALGYYWQIGAGSQQLPGSPTLYTCMGTGESGARSGHQLIHCDIPASTTLQLRATCSGTAEVHNCAIYGVY